MLVTLTYLDTEQLPPGYYSNALDLKLPDILVMIISFNSKYEERRLGMPMSPYKVFGACGEAQVPQCIQPACTFSCRLRKHSRGLPKSGDVGKRKGEACEIPENSVHRFAIVQLQQA